jgi:hypothetical protein
MSDIADILGISHGAAAGRSAGSSSASMGEEAIKIMHASQAGSANDFKRKKKPKGTVSSQLYSVNGCIVQH